MRPSTRTLQCWVTTGSSRHTMSTTEPEAITHLPNSTLPYTVSRPFSRPISGRVIASCPPSDPQRLISFLSQHKLQPSLVAGFLTCVCLSPPIASFLLLLLDWSRWTAGPLKFPRARPPSSITVTTTAQAFHCSVPCCAGKAIHSPNM